MSNVLTQFFAYLTDFGRYVNKLLASTGAGGDSSSWVIGLFIIFAVFLIGFTLGRTKMFLALLSIYGAAYIEANIPSVWLSKFLENTPEYWVHAGLFLITYLIIFMALSRSLIKGRLSTKEMSFTWIAVLAVLEIGLLISIFSSYFTPESHILPAGLTLYFGTKTARFIWAALPVAVTIFLKGKKEASA